MNKKTNKKIVTSILSASILSISLGSVSFAAASSFQDLKGVTGQEKIVSLHSQKIANGVSDTTFAPNTSLTQAQAIQLLVNGFKLDAILGTVPLEDSQKLTSLFPAVQNNAWYADAFREAYKNGMDIPKSIDPAAKITREQYVDYLMTALQTIGKMPATDVAAQDIKDLDKLDTNYLDSVQVAMVFGIVKLDNDKNFNPKKEITRAEAAVMLYDAIEYLKKTAAGERTIDTTLEDRTIDTTNEERTIDVLPHKQPTANKDSKSGAAIASDSYAAPANNEKVYFTGVKQALEKYANQDVKYFVAIDLFANSTPVDVNSKEAQAEIKRLKALNYDVDVAKAWTYEGDLQKVDYKYVGAYLTADQLKNFKTSDKYGYAFSFATNGDGSSVTAKAGAINNSGQSSTIAE